MDNSSSEVRTLLGLFETLLSAIVDSRLELSPSVCANVLYGLQNCSIADESTRRIVYLLVSRLVLLSLQFLFMLMYLLILQTVSSLTSITIPRWQR